MLYESFIGWFLLPQLPFALIDFPALQTIEECYPGVRPLCLHLLNWRVEVVDGQEEEVPIVRVLSSYHVFDLLDSSLVLLRLDHFCLLADGL